MYSGVLLFEEPPPPGIGHGISLMASETADVAQGLDFYANSCPLVAVWKHIDVEVGLYIYGFEEAFVSGEISRST